MLRRHELTNEEWEFIKPYLPSNKHHEGHPWGNHRKFLNGMIWRLATGAPWRDLPERYGPWNSVYQRFHRWSESGFIEQLAFVLQAELEARGSIDWSLWSLDSSMIRASKAAAGARKKSVGKKIISYRL